jgi:hypothetical protein
MLYTWPPTTPRPRFRRVHGRATQKMSLHVVIFFFAFFASCVKTGRQGYLSGDVLGQVLCEYQATPHPNKMTDFHLPHLFYHTTYETNTLKKCLRPLNIPVQKHKDILFKILKANWFTDAPANFLSFHRAPIQHDTLTLCTRRSDNIYENGMAIEGDNGIFVGWINR